MSKRDFATMDDKERRRRRSELVTLMERYRLSARAVAMLTDTTKTTVHGWTCDPDTTRHSPIPKRLMRLLKLELGIAEPVNLVTRDWLADRARQEANERLREQGF